MTVFSRSGNNPVDQDYHGGEQPRPIYRFDVTCYVVDHGLKGDAAYDEFLEYVWKFPKLRQILKRDVETVYVWPEGVE